MELKAAEGFTGVRSGMGCGVGGGCSGEVVKWTRKNGSGDNDLFEGAGRDVATEARCEEKGGGGRGARLAFWDE